MDIAVEAVDSLHHETEILRGLADFPQDIWGDRFDSFVEDDRQVISFSLLLKDLRYIPIIFQTCFQTFLSQRL